MLAIVRRHGLRLPRDLALLLTVLLIAEGLVAVLDPDFRFAEALAPYARRQLLAQHDSRRGAAARRAVRRRPRGAGRRTFRHGSTACSRSIETGGLEVRLRTDELDALLARAERVGNRVAASVLAAA